MAAESDEDLQGWVVKILCRTSKNLASKAFSPPLLKPPQPRHG
jgi:hypothetical protein